MPDLKEAENVEPFNPLVHTPINDPIGTARRLQQSIERQQQQALAAGLQPAAPVHSPAWIEQNRIEQDPATWKRIAKIAQYLLRRYPNDAVPIVVEVEIPAGLPGLQQRIGRAEVYRAWPIGEHEYMYKDSIMRADMALAAPGRIIRLDTCSRPPTVRLTEQMRWRDPDSSPPWGSWKAKVLGKLEADARARRDSPAQTFVPTPLVGAPISARTSRKGHTLIQKRNVLLGKLQMKSSPYGTRENPAQHGKPTKGARKAWREHDAIKREISAIDRQLKALGFEE